MGKHCTDPDVRLFMSGAGKINFHCSKHPVTVICHSSLGVLTCGTSLHMVKQASSREETGRWASLSVHHMGNRKRLLPPTGWRVGTCGQKRSMSTQGSLGHPREGMPHWGTVSPQLRPSWFLSVSLAAPVFSPPLPDVCKPYSSQSLA